MTDLPSIGFSVVLPLYNKCESVSRSIQSVLDQTYAEFELIIVNDGSTDGSELKVGNIQDARIRLINQENQGVSAARNKGIAEAKYDYVAFIDADDLWHSEYLSTIFNLIKQYPHEACYGTAWQSWLRDKAIPKTREKTLSSNIELIDYPQHSLVDVIVHICSLVVKREVLDSLGGFPVGVKIFEDQDLCCRLSRQHKIVFEPTPMVYYVKDAENRACDLRKLQPMPPFFTDCEALMMENHERHSQDWYLKEFLIARYLQEVSLATQTPGARKIAMKWLSLCRATEIQKIRYYKSIIYMVIPSKLLELMLSRLTMRRKNKVNAQLLSEESGI